MKLDTCPSCGSGVTAADKECRRCGLSTLPFLSTTRRAFVGESLALASLPPVLPGILRDLLLAEGVRGSTGDRASTFAAFDPSFFTIPVGQLRELFVTAFTEARKRVSFAGPIDQTEFVAEGVLAGPGLTGAQVLSFGHIGSGGTSAARSEYAPYRLTVVFDNEELESVKLTVYFLNPRVRLSDGVFAPATYDAPSRKVTPVPGAPSIVGLDFRAVPAGQAVYDAVRAKLPAAAFGPVPAGFNAYSQTTLRSRFDISIDWPVKGAARSRDVFGKPLGIPNAAFPVGAADQNLDLYAPGVSAPINALLHTSRRLALTIGAADKYGIDLILEDLKEPGAAASASERTRWARLRLLRQSFGVQKDFRGLLFGGLGAHLLDDQLRGHENVTVSLGATAIALNGTAVEDGSEQARWYTSIRLDVRNHAREPLFGVLAPQATLDVAIAAGSVRYVSLKGSIVLQTTPDDALPDGFKWLAGKDVVVSLARYSWTDKSERAHSDWALELAVLGSGERALAVIDADKDFGGDQAAFDGFLTTLAFGPIVLRTKPIDPDLVVPASDAKSRGYFAEVMDATSLAVLYAATNFNPIFKNAITGRSLRVTGAYLRDQPRAVNKSGANPDDRETALLFDYEADYAVDLAGMKTTRSVTTRIHGTGFKVGAGGFAWVQVPNGLYDLSLDDPGLWDLNGLGKLLRLVSLSVRSRDGKGEIVVRLRLAANFGQVKADDFVFVLGLRGSSGIEAYPSSVELDFPGSFRAKGLLLISDAPPGSGAKDVLGSLDLTLIPARLRMFAGLRVSQVAGGGTKHTALIASAAVDLPTPIPLAATGVTITGFEGLFATHFVRAEQASNDVPPALQWLVDAEGKVAESINDKTLWKPEYDHWTFALGATLAILGAKRLLNLNGVLAVELPGPRVLVFSKLNVLTAPKSNSDKPKELIKGALGILDVDNARKEITLAVLLDQDFRDLIRVHAPLQLFASMQRLSNWHFYLGQYSAPVTARLTLGGIVDVGGELYLMAAGHDLIGGPWPSGRVPGFGLAFGFHAFVKIGGSALYIRVAFRADLAASFSRHLYLYGGIGLSGEINPWIIAIGASGTLALEYLKASPEAPDQMHAIGSVCGSIKILFRKLKGCVSFELGNTFVGTQPLPPLVTSVSFVSAPEAVKLGQGAFRPTDGSSAMLDDASTGPALDVPIDTVIAMSMVAPAHVNAGLPGGLLDAPGAGTFNFGGVTSAFHLTELVLTEASAGSVLNAQTPIRWWASSNSSAGGQALPTTLALLTKNPFGLSNALPPSVDLQNLIGEPCRAVLPPQNCLYHFVAEDRADRPKAQWRRPSVLCSTAVEASVGRSGVRDLVISVEQPFVVPPESAGLPLRAAYCAPEEGDQGVADTLRMTAIRVGDRTPDLTARMTTEAISRRAPIRLLMALPRSDAYRYRFAVEMDNGTTVAVSPRLTDMSNAGARRGFHEDCERWRDMIERWCALAFQARFGNLRFVSVDIDARVLTGNIVGVVFTLTPPSSEQPGARALALLGALKFTPLGEEARAASQTEARQQRLNAVVSLFDRTKEPLLAPASDYALTATYQAAGGSGRSVRTQRYRFRTSAQPPRRLDPYLLAAFPRTAEPFHYTGDAPGLVLTSDLMLRVLVAHGAKLKVTITNDGAQPALDSKGADWSFGRVIDPAALARLDQNIPGIDCRPVAAVPSAIMEQVLEMQRAGKLACLPNLVLPETGVWIGFDLKQKPLTGYDLRIEIVDATGKPWPWPNAEKAADGKAWAAGSIPPGTTPAFYTTRFRTSLYSSTADHAAAIKRATRRNRQALGTLQVPVGERQPEFPGVEVLADKAFDDALAAAIGERPRRDGGPSITLLWGRVEQPTPIGILVEANEPILRQALVPNLLSSDGGSFSHVDIAPRPFSGPRVIGASRTILSSSGCAMLVILPTVLQAKPTIQLVDIPLERVPRTVVSESDVYSALAQAGLGIRNFEETHR